MSKLRVSIGWPRSNSKMLHSKRKSIIDFFELFGVRVLPRLYRNIIISQKHTGVKHRKTVFWCPQDFGCFDRIKQDNYFVSEILLKPCWEKDWFCCFYRVSSPGDSTSLCWHRPNARTRQLNTIISWQKSVHGQHSNGQNRDISCSHQKIVF